MYKRANAAIDLKKYDLAVSMMKDVISSHPDYSHAYYITAKAYFWAGDYDKSEEYIRQALSFYATNNDYLVQLSATLALNEKYDEALENVDNALASEPTNSLAIYYKAYCLFRKGEYKRAENILLWYLEQYPNDDVAHCVLGGIYHRLGDLNLAEKEFREALRLNPNNAVTLNDFSLLYLGNDNQKTLELLKEAIRLKPDDEIIENNIQDTLETIKNEKGGYVMLFINLVYSYFLNKQVFIIMIFITLIILLICYFSKKYYRKFW